MVASPAVDVRGAFTFAQAHYAHSIALAPEASEADATAWCRTRFGRPGAIRRIRPAPVPASRYTLRSDKNWCRVGPMFYFHDERHAFEFKMRWA